MVVGKACSHILPVVAHIVAVVSFYFTDFHFIHEIRQYAISCSNICILLSVFCRPLFHDAAGVGVRAKVAQRLLAAESTCGGTGDSGNVAGVDAAHAAGAGSAEIGASIDLSQVSYSVRSLAGANTYTYDGDSDSGCGCDCDCD